MVPLQRVGEMMKGVLTELKELGGQARLRDLLQRVEPRLNLTDYEKATLPKSGLVRWETYVHFYSINCVKAGYIQKTGGKWVLTEQGAEALKLAPLEFIQSATRKYREWQSTRITSDDDDAADESVTAVRQAAYEQAVEQAQREIEEHINNLDPYDFQKLVAELLTAMGYHVPYIAPPGRDGGIDVIAYKDPLGTSSPRISVQIKHRDQKTTVKDVRELEGLLRKPGDIGLLVSSGGFTSEVERETRASTKHIETMDLDRLIDLWQQHYDQVREPGKQLLPLVKLHFLAPAQE